jgi:Protein of unknown function (DUF1553)/Protein of unknown function (DUF1549)/Planctomycete cytochrome C
MLRLLALSILVITTQGEAAISFAKQVRPVLSEYCFACHGPDDQKREGGLRLDDEAAAKAMTKDGAAIVAGKPELSMILQRITSTDPDEVMPPVKQHKVMPAKTVEMLRTWVAEGAVWGRHWSYEVVKRPAVPAGAGNAIDAFVQQRLAGEGLKPAPRADTATLIRRLALDLTGLPPDLAELDALTGKVGAGGEMQGVIAHFLKKPTFGEHWARQWLDLARYADSSGYPSDQPREIWAYRDWVIKALNQNQRFDEFTIDQLAGDLRASPSEDQRIATAFHRNTMTQNEGGTSDEEFRNAAVIDRVNTTMAVWMGTSMACAQCHTHKYDPITITEYFKFYAFLNQSADSDKKDEAPLHEIWRAGERDLSVKLQADATKLRAELAAFKVAQLPGYAEWSRAGKEVKSPPKVVAALALPEAKRDAGQQALLLKHYIENVAPETKTQRGALSSLEKRITELKPVTVPVMKELPVKEQRVTRVQLRGNWQALDATVTPGTPAGLHPLPPGAKPDRMTMARWLVARDNPLTARVIMNRLWESFFGLGIVATSEDFGAQGELPSHPELLDWLAVEFMDSGWDLQHMMTLILSSQTYQQQSLAVVAEDPDNRLLARGPRFRPSGELLRDQALAVSALLSPTMFGPGVRPRSPNLGLTTAFGRSNDWTTSPGADAYRRSVYTEVRRNSPYASFSTFDGTNREVCTLRRNRTNTPLQALVTLNDPVFVEAAQSLGRRLLKEATTDEARLQLAFRLCLSRLPKVAESQRLLKLLHEMQASELDTKGTKDAAAQIMTLATDPLGPLPAGVDPLQAACWTTLANVIMNLDEFVMRR